VRALLKLIAVVVTMAIFISAAVIVFTLTTGGLHDATKWSWIHGLFGRELVTVKRGRVGIDADLRFRVTGFGCEAAGVDNKCRAELKVQNEGDEADLDPGLQYLILDDETLKADGLEPSTKLTKGSSAKTLIWNDVPRGGVRSIELHASLLSNGVLVKLRD
jgi:hypothetical protein